MNCEWWKQPIPSVASCYINAKKIKNHFCNSSQIVLFPFKMWR